VLYEPPESVDNFRNSNNEAVFIIQVRLRKGQILVDFRSCFYIWGVARISAEIFIEGRHASYKDQIV
jgi:hypothetical protein